MRQHSSGQMYTHTTKEEQTRIIKPSQSHKQPNAKNKKKKKKKEKEYQKKKTHKNGIHLKFSNMAAKKFRCPNLTSKSV